MNMGVIEEHEPGIRLKIKNKLRKRLSLKPSGKMYFWKTKQKLSTKGLIMCHFMSRGLGYPYARKGPFRSIC